MILVRLAVLALCGAGIICMITGDSLRAGDKDKKDDGPKKVKLTGTVKTGIAAIGGETTGTIIETKDGNYELQVSKELRKEVDALNKKLAEVTGTLETKKGLAVKLRKIVTVETIKAAEAK